VEFIDAASFLSAYTQIFEREIYTFSTEQPAPMILDCGANIGLAVMYWKRLFPEARIVAFEPDPGAFLALQSNCMRWSLGDVELVDAAVWTESGESEFLSDGADAGRLLTPRAKDTGSGMVRTVRLRDYLTSHVALLKLDVEGAETDVLRDCADRLDGVERLFVEWHSFVDDEQSLDELLSILRAAGFRFHLHPELVSPSPFRSVRENAGMDQRLNIFAFRRR
jgi:FkbM family methyltransferase